MNANQGLLPVQTGASFPKLDTGHPQPDSEFDDGFGKFGSGDISVSVPFSNSGTVYMTSSNLTLYAGGDSFPAPFRNSYTWVSGKTITFSGFQPYQWGDGGFFTSAVPLAKGGFVVD